MSFEYAAYLAFILAGTFAIKKRFNVQLPPLRLAKTLLAVAAIFVAWDALAVAAGHWSFNPAFLLGVFVGNQPVEEIAFFFIVPFFYVTIWEIAKQQGRKNENKKPKTKTAARAKNENQEKPNARVKPNVKMKPKPGGRLP